MAVQGTLTNNRVDMAENRLGTNKKETAPVNVSTAKAKGASVNDYYNSILKSLGSSAITPERINYESLGYDMPT